jgi:hypothetical protein
LQRNFEAFAEDDAPAEAFPDDARGRHAPSSAQASSAGSATTQVDNRMRMFIVALPAQSPA